MGDTIIRKLASIQKIEEIKLIAGADAICAYRVLGWWVVDQINKYSLGDLVVFITIDSWVPTELAPFLSKSQEPREYNGVKGERLRTIRLRGQVSQGLLLKISDLYEGKLEYLGSEPKEGEDMTEVFGIQKWEAPISAQLQGQAAGMFPTSLIPKTDQERIQNMFGDIQKKAKRFLTEKVWNSETQTLEEHPVIIPEGFQEPTYEVTMKLDGSSMTLFRWEGQLRVCSRNLEMKINEENKDNTFVKKALEIGDFIPDGFAFQGEIIGPNIQGNREGLSHHLFLVFDIFDIQKHEYLNPSIRRAMTDRIGLGHVPVLGTDWKAPNSVEEGLALAEGPSINHKVREGLVWKCNEDPSFSFKAISNKFLLSGGE